MKIKALIILTFLTNLVHAQFKTNLSPMVNFHSANAMSLGQFGDVPVSLYTGTPDIAVPIHKLNERGVELDISLQYNAKGVRVEDVPGWVGQNWALNAGGVITRSVRGTSFDELNFFRDKDIQNQLVTPEYVQWSTSIGSGYFYLGIFQRGYFYHTQKLNTSGWNNITYLNDLAYSSYINTYQNQEYKKQNWRMDLEPDIFTFNFMGHSGHFFLGQDGQWKVSSKSNLKVYCDLNADIGFPVPLIPAAGIAGTGQNPFMIRFPKVISKIVLADDKGIRYYFEQVELTFTNILSQRPPYNNDSRCISSAFYLTKVKDISNNTLYEFEYEKGSWQGKFSVAFENNFYNYDSMIGTPVTNSAISAYNPAWNWHKYGFGAPGQLILPSYLKKIKSESGTEIDFNSTLVQNALKYTRGGNPLIDNRSETFYGMDPVGNTDLYFLFKEADLVTDSSVLPYTFSSIWDRLKNKKLTSITIKDNSKNAIAVNFDYIDTSGVRLFLNGLNFNGTKKYKFDYSGYFLPGFLDMSTDRLGYYNNKQFKFTISRLDTNYWTNELPALKETNDYVKTGSLSKITYPSGGYIEFEFEPHSYSKKLNQNNELIAGNGFIGGLRIKKIISSFNNSVETKEYFYQKSISNTTSSGNLIYNPVYSIDSGIIDHPIQNLNNGAKLYSRSLNSLVSMSNLMGVQVEYTDVIEKKTGNGYVHYKFSNYEEFSDTNPVMLHSKALPFVPKTDKSFERGSLKERLVYNESGNIVQKDEFKYYAHNPLLVNAVNINFGYQIGCLGCGNDGEIFWMLPFTAAYQMPYTDKYVIEETNTSYDPGGRALTTLKSNKYVRYPDASGTILNNGSIFMKNEYTTESVFNLGTFKTFQYPFEFNNSITNAMVSKNILSVTGEKIEKTDGDPYDSNSTESISETKLDYQSVYNSSLGDYIPLPKESFIRKGDNAFEKEFLYTNYDAQGNIVEYKKQNGVPVSIVWGYHNTKPLAILENVAYQNIPNQTITNLLSLSNQDIDNGINGITENNLRTALNSLRNSFPDAMIKTYTYDSLTGVTWFSDVDEAVQYFEYDDLLRVKTIRDKDGFLLKQNEYKYKTLIDTED